MAYRDGVLDPKDAAVLETKIKDSSTAQQISQRIEHEMQNRRLAPIPVDAREFGFEANLVAEFLDDTIPMETLPEMERKCLENNTLLSEIGSCHQILSRALSIPAHITATLRQRIRELPNSPALNRTSDAKGRIRRTDSPRSASAATSESKTAVVLDSTKPMRKRNGELRGSGIELHDGLGSQVPEYLVGSNHGWLKSAAIAVSLLLAFVVVGAMAIGPVDRVRDLLSKSEGIVGAESNVKNSTKKSAARKVDADRIDTVGTIDESSFAPPAPPATPFELSPTVEPKSSVKSTTSPPTPVNSSKNGALNGSDLGAKPPVVAASNRIQWLPESKPSAESIVLKFSSAESNSAAFWKRMSPGEFINAGDRVVVPPTQRTEMRVEPGIRLLCAGENDMELAKVNELPRVVLRSGRVLIFATPDAKEIRLACNGLDLQIKFVEADGSCALEIHNQWSTNNVVLARAGKFEIQTNVRLIGVEGALKYSAKYRNSTEEKGDLGVGQFVDWKNGATTEAKELAEAPWWFRTSIKSAIETPAAADLQRAVTGNTPEEIETKLLELTNVRQNETAALAARTRILLGRFDGLFEPVGVFNRERLHVYWTALLEQIPESLGREEHRDQLANAIRTVSSNRAESIFSLLIPSSQEQLSAGADKLLVEALSSPHLDERVLSFNQLKSITGKTLGYHPEKNQVEAVQQWRKLLGKSEIRYSTPTNSKSE